MSCETPARGLTGDWLNAWLAAIGITVLLPEVRLRWTTDPCPHAVLVHDGTHSTMVERIAAAVPTESDLGRLVIAKHLDGQPTLGQRFTKDVFATRAGLARANGDWTLGVVATDAVETDEPANGPFNTPAPKGLTLHDRLVACRVALGDDPVDRIERSLTGPGERVKLNGLGFDVTRILVASDPRGDKWVDPVIEVLAFFGLVMSPCRSNGHTRAAKARGWLDAPTKKGAFCWPTWQPALSVTAIDGLLDTFWVADQNRRTTRSGPGSRSTAWPPGVTRAYQTVPYQAQGSSDATRGYASEPLP